MKILTNRNIEQGTIVKVQSYSANLIPITRYCIPVQGNICLTNNRISELYVRVIFLSHPPM